MRITAAVSRTANTPFVLEEIEIDEPRADEIRVRIVAVGLCHTDLVGAAGAFPIRFPAVFGHEGAGIVEQVGSAVQNIRAGDRVAISFRSCGRCENCDDRQPAYCTSMPLLNYIGARLDGSRTLHDGTEDVSGNFFGQSSFASHAITYERNLVKLPDDLPLEIAGTLGCGVQTGAGAIMNSLACRAGSSLLILGGGAVGLSAVLGAVLQGCKEIIVVEPLRARRELALALGATRVIDPATDPLPGALRAVLPNGTRYVFDTTGIPKVMEDGIACLGLRGSFGYVGVPADPGAKLPGSILGAMQQGHTHRGIIEGDSDPETFIPQLIEQHRAGRFPFDRLITTYPLAEINRAVAEQHQGLCVKAVLVTGES
jgi:aryl-alcohol dehydrogenase